MWVKALAWIMGCARAETKMTWREDAM